QLHVLPPQYNTQHEQLSFPTRRSSDLNETTLGFIGIQHNYKNESVTRIHKIYLLPETQGKGIGKKVIEEIQKMALQNHSKTLSRSEEHTSELQSRENLVCRLLLEKKNN